MAHLVIAWPRWADRSSEPYSETVPRRFSTSESTARGGAAGWTMKPLSAARWSSRRASRRSDPPVGSPPRRGRWRRGSDCARTPGRRAPGDGGTAGGTPARAGHRTRIPISVIPRSRAKLRPVLLAVVLQEANDRGLVLHHAAVSQRNDGLPGVNRLDHSLIGQQGGNAGWRTHLFHGRNRSRQAVRRQEATFPGDTRPNPARTMP